MEGERGERKREMSKIRRKVGVEERRRWKKPEGEVVEFHRS